MFRTPYVEKKVTSEGIKTEAVENRSGGNDVTVTVPVLRLNSKANFKKYNGSWIRRGSLYVPPRKEEKKDG